MSTRSLRLSCTSLAAAVAACTGDPSRGTHGGFVIEDIGREVTFAEPIPARLFVDYRAVSYPGRTVEYGVEVDGMPMVVTYAIDPSSARPLQTRIFDGVAAEPVLVLVADDRTLEISGAGVSGVLTVDAYTDPMAATSAGLPMVLTPQLRPLLDAVLPARSELAPVPAFWQNIDQPADGDHGEIGQSSSSGRPLLDSWSAPVSLLGSLFLQSPCIAAAGYRCPCMHVDTPAVGEVETCSGAPPRQTHPYPLRGGTP